MFSGALYNRKFIPATILFAGAGIYAITQQQALVMLLPFAWVLLPVITELVIKTPAKLFCLLCIVIPLSTELNITPQLGLDFPDELLLMALTGITIVKIIHTPSWFPRALETNRLFLLLLLQLGWILVTCFYSTEPVLSYKYLLAKLWYIVPFVILPQVLFSNMKNIQRMALSLLIPMLVVVIITLMRHSFYHFSFEDINKTLAPFFRNHVNYSSMLVCLLPVVWCVWKLTSIGVRKNILLLGILIGLAALIFAYSRGAWVALVMGVIAVWIIRKKLMGAMVLAAVTGILVSTVWLVTDNNYLRFAPDHDKTIFHTNFTEHMEATVRMKDVSTAERFYRWVAGARMLADKPLTGFGPNSFYAQYKPYTVASFKTWVSDNKEHSTVHNYFILIALEQGVIGLILFCILYFSMLLQAQQLYHQIQSRFYRMVALTTGIILVMIGVINSMSDMIETDKIGSLFWLCLGMIILLRTREKDEKNFLAGDSKIDHGEPV